MSIPKIFEPEQFAWAYTMDQAQEYASNRAQRIFENWYHKSRLIYFGRYEGNGLRYLSETAAKGDTHTVDLLHIRPIEPKECMHQRKSSRFLWDFWCEDCGKKLKPKTWETVE